MNRKAPSRPSFIKIKQNFLDKICKIHFKRQFYVLSPIVALHTFLEKRFNQMYSTNVNTMGSQSVHSVW